MKHYTLIFTSILMLLCGRVNAQYEDVSVKLGIINPNKNTNPIRLRAYTKVRVDTAAVKEAYARGGNLNRDSLEYVYCYKVETYDVDKGVHPIDTTIIISKNQFNHIIEMALSLSPKDMIIGMSATELLIHGRVLSTQLTIDVLGDEVAYTVHAPNSYTEERNLNDYVTLCKEMLKLAGLPKKSLK